VSSAPYPGKLRGDFASLKRMGIPGGGDYHGPGTTKVMQGLRTVWYRCPCGVRNRGPYTVGLQNKVPCKRCHEETVQERVL
jgi:hypothetical protein